MLAHNFCAFVTDTRQKPAHAYHKVEEKQKNSNPARKEMRFRMLHGRLGSIGDVIRQVDQKLGQAALGSGIIAQNR